MNCKLIGQYVQYLEVTLAPGEEFFTEKGSIIYMENGIDKEAKLNGRGLGSILGAKFSGESIFIISARNISNMPRKIAVGGTSGMHHVKINGETMICRRGAYIASSAQVSVSAKFSIKGLMGGMGLLLQKISGCATVFLDTIGQPIVINLQPGETIEIDENHIIAMLNISDAQMNANWSFGNLIAGEGLSTLYVTGPGTVILSPGKPLPPTK